MHVGLIECEDFIDRDPDDRLAEDRCTSSRHDRHISIKRKLFYDVIFDDKKHFTHISTEAIQFFILNGRIFEDSLIRRTLRILDENILSRHD